MVIALGLAVGLLLAVSYAQSPESVRTVAAVVRYTAVASGFSVLNPPATTPVTVLAPSALPLPAAAITVEANLTNIRKVGVAVVHSTLRTKPDAATITDVSPLALQIDSLSTLSLPVDVRASSIPSGWSLDATKTRAACGNGATQCVVTVTGPNTAVDGLSAYVASPAPINGTFEVQLPVQFERAGKPVDLGKLLALPPVSWAPATALTHFEATRISQSRPVALVDSPPTHGPASGYRISSVSIDPSVAAISGPNDVIVKYDSITVPPVDLSRATTTRSFVVSVSPPDPATQLSISKATITYTIEPNPNVQPSATPTASPVPTPTASH